MVADRLLGDYNFDNEVVAVNGWCYYEDLLSCTVFVLPDAEDDAEAEDEEDEDEDQEAPDSVAVDFSVEFLPDSAIPFNWHGGSA